MNLKKLCGVLLGLTACSTTAALNEQYVGQEFYVCDWFNDENLSVGKKTVKDITFAQNYGFYDVELLTDKGASEHIRLRSSSQELPAKLQQKFSEAPFCSAQEFQNMPSVITDLKTAENAERNLSQNPDIIQTLALYSDFYVLSSHKNICEAEVVDFTQFGEDAKGINSLFLSFAAPQDDLLKIAQKFTEPDKNLACFMTSLSNNRDNSDECILARRNSKKSQVCYFNYAKYLPKNLQVKSDEQFLALVNVYHKLFRDSLRWNDAGQLQYYSYCDLLKETTSAEKEQCKQQAAVFIQQLAQNKAPHCRSKIPTEYQNFLRQSVKQFSFLNEVMTSEVEDNLYASRMEKKVMGNIYQSAFASAFVDNIQSFGIYHFCRTDGFEQDLKKLKKR